MKFAKKRQLPILVRLLSSNWRANRAIDSAVAFIATSNRRLAKRKTLSLEQLMVEMPEGFPDDLKAWENMAPVGLEVIDHGEGV